MPRHPRALVVIAAAVATAIVLTGCAGVEPSSPGERLDGGTIVYAHQQEPACVFGGWIEQAYLSYQVLDNLVSLDADHRVVPWLAASWTESADRLSWTFILQPGVEFSDGMPVDADAVAANFEYWAGGGNSTAQLWLLGYYASATAVDDVTVRVDLLQPYPRLADNLTQAYFGIQSPHALQTRTDEENCSAPIGSGAFVVDHWDRGQEIVLTRNDAYTSWPANAVHTGPAYVERVVWKFVPDATTRVAALQSDEVDAIYDVPAIQWAALDDSGYLLEKYVTPGRPQQLTFNTQTGPFSDERVRQAFAYSLDRELIVDTIGQGVIPFDGNGGVSRTTPGYSQAAADRYELDLDRANDLLDDAGWDEVDDEGFRTRNGERLTVVLPYGAGSIINADGAAILQGVKEQATATGFDVQLIPVPVSELFAGAYSQPDERDIAVGYWTAVTAGILYINWRPSTPDNPNYSNQAFYTDDALTQLILDGNSAADIDEQNALYGQAQEYIADHALAIGLYDRLSTLAVDPNLRGVWQEHAQGGPTFYDAYFVG
jgi:peptide/nickel transport system substrate-binding protein